MLLQGKWTNYDSSNSALPLGYRIRETMAAGSDGRVWMMVGKQGIDGILMFDDLRSRYYSLTEIGLPVLNYGDLACDGDGSVWLYALVEGLLYRFDGVTATVFRAGEKGLAVSSLLVCDFATDMQGHLWMAMTNGNVYRFNGIQWLRMGPTKGNPNWQVTRMATDRTGRIWFVVIEDNGMHFVWFDGEKYQEYAVLQPDHKAGTLDTFAVDHLGNLWIGWGESGIWVCDHETLQWAKLTTKNCALIDKYILSIVVDPKNRVWIGTDSGLTIFEGKDSGYWGRITPGATMQLGSVDELRRAKRRNEAPFPNLNYPTVARQVVLDSHGRLWAWGGSSVSVFSEE